MEYKRQPQENTHSVDEQKEIVHDMIREKQIDFKPMSLIEEFENGLGKKIAPVLNETLSNHDNRFPFGYKMVGSKLEPENKEMEVFIKWLSEMKENGFDEYEIMRRLEKYNINHSYM